MQAALLGIFVKRCQELQLKKTYDLLHQVQRLLGHLAVEGRPGLRATDEADREQEGQDGQHATSLRNCFR